MKAFKVIAILALLVAFPAISYLYLMRGYNFRLEALQELEPKKKLDKFEYVEGGIDVLTQKATLLFNGNNQEALDYMKPVYDEFSHREEFQLIGFVEDSSSLKMFPYTSQWYTVIGKYPYEKQISIVDTAANIRNYYDFDSSSFTNLIQHIPIIIPREKEEDIVLKREDEK